MVRKLQGYGIDGKVLKWVRHFLSCRRQRVRINGVMSSWEDVVSGVPQGSVLGPTLFVLFINDMPQMVDCCIQLFADDAKIFGQVGGDNEVDLMENLSRLEEWATKWQMKFNAKKCKVMHLGKKNPLRSYHMQGIELDVIEDERDLGVIIDNELKFHKHHNTQVNKANSILGLIRRSFDYLDKGSFLSLYKTLVRPHLEYCNAVTFPQYELDAKALEDVQRRATKLVPDCRELEYEDRLRYLELPSLAYRRRRGDIIETYKYLQKKYDVNPSPLILEDLQISTRGHALKLRKERCNRSRRQHFFTQRIVNPWNSLPSEVINAPSLDALKNRLDKLWFNFQYQTDFNN